MESGGKVISVEIREMMEKMTALECRREQQCHCTDILKNEKIPKCNVAFCLIMLKRWRIGVGERMRRRLLFLSKNVAYGEYKMCLIVSTVGWATERASGP